jgi:hypothetical protein
MGPLIIIDLFFINYFFTIIAQTRYPISNGSTFETRNACDIYKECESICYFV